MSRKAFIAGNWKMNMTAESGEKLIKELAPLVKNASCEIGRASCRERVLSHV